MDEDEWADAIRFVVERTAKRVPVVAGAGSNNTAHAIALCRRAEKLGADGLLAVTPYYNKTTQGGLVAHFKAIAEAVHTPVILYNVPSRTGLNMKAEAVAALAGVPNIHAVKEASGDLAQVFDRLGLAYKRTVEDFVVDPPFERRDLSIPEDLAEEVGRILGYESLPPLQLAPREDAPDQKRLAGIERVKDFLIERGFTEVSTQSFAKDGARVLMNPLQDDRPALRDSLLENMQAAIARAAYDAPRSFGPIDAIRLFEIGTVWKHDREHLSLILGTKPLRKMKGDLAAETAAALAAEFGFNEPVTSEGIAEIDLSGVDFEALGEGRAIRTLALGMFEPYSPYPFILRDIALWAPSDAEGPAIVSLIRQHAGDWLARIDQFDRFDRDGRSSYAVRLVFQSMERTLSDDDVNPVMEKISAALAAQGYEIR